jgi:O-methyltransferase involved in polyketide biosynthesis
VLEPRKILLKTARFIPIYSPVAAGSHGRLLAQRHIDILPELRDMVVARTKNIDDFLLDAIGKGA